MATKKAAEKNQRNELFFFYGTLKDADRRFGDRGIKRLGSAITTNRYVVDHFGPYPAVLKESGAGAARIIGDVFSIPANQIPLFDRIEKNSKLYNREKIKALLLPGEINHYEASSDLGGRNGLKTLLKPIEAWFYFAMEWTKIDAMIWGEGDRPRWASGSEFRLFAKNDAIAELQIKAILRDRLDQELAERRKRFKAELNFAAD